ncbi:MAG: hypothetical protein DRP70_09035 [Spirochaetes bacterium]|nr:MAG: hypothetical protein DRP70_09035 [Spirochaetota bacterium]
MPELWIPSGTGHSDFTERKSRFIGEARKVSGAEEARLRIKKLRLEHPRSRHVAWAYILGKDAALKGMSDDGEPRGTAGRPIMDPIKGNSLTDTLVTVVRYFGGVKLGTGGLSSAYGKSSQESLAGMPRVRLIERIRVELGIEYSVYEQVVRLIREADGLIVQELFEFGVKVVVDLPVSMFEEFRRNVKDISRGAAQFEVNKKGESNES